MRWGVPPARTRFSPCLSWMCPTPRLTCCRGAQSYPRSERMCVPMQLRLRSSFALLLTALWVTPALAQQQTGSILGRVTDALSQRPVQGATLIYAGKTAVARPDGSYLLNGLP